MAVAALNARRVGVEEREETRKVYGDRHEVEHCHEAGAAAAG